MPKYGGKLAFVPEEPTVALDTEIPVDALLILVDTEIPVLAFAVFPLPIKL